MSQPVNSPGIAWREWSEEAFEDARAEEKPVLLTLGATWCHWCHVMDQTSYSDERVIGLINSSFIPVRVDVDQRPDISLRYNQGGFPSVAFLAGTGEFITGRPYTPPDDMVTLLRQVSSGEVAANDGRAEATPAHAGGSAGRGSVDAVQGRLRELYDTEFGGFGVEPKQPPWEALQFLTVRFGRSGDRELLGMVEATLQGMWHGIYDRKGQGFFRYSVSRDWKVPHYEKMLVSNASLARVYLEAFQITGRGIYRTAVDGIVEYLMNTLFDPDDGLFQASQDADEPYYQMSWKDRDAADAPPVDLTCTPDGMPWPPTRCWMWQALWATPNAGDVRRRSSTNCGRKAGLRPLACAAGLGIRPTLQSSWRTRSISCALFWRCTRTPGMRNTWNVQPGWSRRFSACSARPTAVALTRLRPVHSRQPYFVANCRCWKTPTGLRP